MKGIIVNILASILLTVFYFKFPLFIYSLFSESQPRNWIVFCCFVLLWLFATILFLKLMSKGRIFSQFASSVLLGFMIFIASGLLAFISVCVFIFLDHFIAPLMLFLLILSLAACFQYLLLLKFVFPKSFDLITISSSLVFIILVQMLFNFLPDGFTGLFQYYIWVVGFSEIYILLFIYMLLFHNFVVSKSISDKGAAQ